MHFDILSLIYVVRTLIIRAFTQVGLYASIYVTFNYENTETLTI